MRVISGHSAPNQNFWDYEKVSYISSVFQVTPWSCEKEGIVLPRLLTQTGNSLGAWESGSIQ